MYKLISAEIIQYAPALTSDILYLTPYLVEECYKNEYLFAWEIDVLTL